MNYIDNAKPIARVVKVDVGYHVWGMDRSGRLYSAKFQNLKDARRYAQAIQEV